MRKAGVRGDTTRAQFGSQQNMRGSPEKYIINLRERDTKGTRCTELAMDSSVGGKLGREEQPRKHFLKSLIIFNYYTFRLTEDLRVCFPITYTHIFGFIVTLM